MEAHLNVRVHLNNGESTDYADVSFITHGWDDEIVLRDSEHEDIASVERRNLSRLEVFNG